MRILSDDILSRIGLLTVQYKSQSSYTDKPNNALSLPRLLNQEKDFYKTKENVEIHCYKTLVLAEWIVDKNVENILICFFSEWLHLQRSLFVYYRNQAIEITTIGELSSYLPFLNKPVPLQDIYAHLANKNKAADEVVILNQYKVSEIASLSSTNNSVLQEWKLTRLDDYHVIYLGHLLNQGITFDEVSQSTTERDGTLNCENTNQHGVHFEQAIQSLLETDLFAGLAIDKPALESICSTLREKPRTLSFSKIKTTGIDIDNADFIFFLQHCPQFQTLDFLAPHSFYSAPSAALSVLLQKLKSLTLRGIDCFDAAFFKDTQLDDLTIVVVAVDQLEEQLGTAFPVANNENEHIRCKARSLLEKTPLDSLRSLNLQDYSISCFNFLKSTPKLTHLMVTTGAVESLQIYGHVCSPLLRCFSFEGGVAVEHSLAKLLTTMRNLDYLSVVNDISTDNGITIDFLNWRCEPREDPLLANLPQNIKKLHTHTCRVNGKGIAREKIQATYLGQAIIRLSLNSLVSLNFSLSDENDAYFPDYFYNLKHLVLYYIANDDAAIKTHEFAELLQQTPNLEYFEYEGVGRVIEDEGDPQVVIEETTLPKLKYLYAIDFPLQLVFRFLRTSPLLQNVLLREGYARRVKEKLLTCIDYNQKNLGENRPLGAFTYLNRTGDSLPLITSYPANHFYIDRYANDKLPLVPRTKFLTFSGSHYPLLLLQLPQLLDPSALKAFTLKEFSLSGQFSIASMRGYQSVEVLHLEFVQFDSFTQFAIFLQCFSQLKVLNLVGGISMNEGELEIMDCLQLKSLRSLSLNFKKGVEKIVNAAPNLERLQIKGTSLSPSEIRRIAKSHPSLVSFAFPVRGYQEDTPIKGKRLNKLVPHVQLTNLPTPNEDKKTALTKGMDSAVENPSFHPQEFFIPKPNSRMGVTYYRLNIHDAKGVAAGEDLTFAVAIDDIEVMLPAFSTPNLHEKYFAEYHETPHIFYGRYKTVISKNSWSTLPSLSPQDQILDIQCSQPVEMGFSKNTGLFHIRGFSDLADEVEVQIILETKSEFLEVNDSEQQLYWEAGCKLFKNLQFTLTPELSLDKKKIDLPLLVKTIYEVLQQTESRQLTKNGIASIFQEGNIDEENYSAYLIVLKSLACFIKQFGQGKLSDHEKNAAGLLNALIKDNKGACRHRSFLFKAVLDAFNIPCRYVTSVPHSFIEVPGIDGNWFTIDLGGYPAHCIPQPTYLTSSATASRMKRKSYTVADDNTAFKMPNPISSQEVRHVELCETSPEAWEDQWEAIAEEDICLDHATSSNQNPFVLEIKPDNPFATWQKQENQSNQFPTFWEQIERETAALKPGTQNVLITLPNKDALEKFCLSLLTLQAQRDKRAFYLASLDEVTFKSAVVENGNYQLGASELVHYLQTPHEGDQLIVNWSNHKPKHIGFNTVVDTDNRRLGEYTLSDTTTVVTLITADKAKSLREDFYSRFRIKKEIPLSFVYSPSPQLAEQLPNPGKEVDLMERDDWKSSLIGTISLAKNQIQAIKGAIIEALEQGIESLQIYNAPASCLADIRLFLQEILIKHFFYFNNKTYPLPVNFSIGLTNKSYTFEADYSIEEIEEINESEYDWLLNKETYESFFTVYSYFEEYPKAFPTRGNLISKEGRINAFTHGKTIKVLVTSEFSDGEWSRLLNYAHTFGTKLHFISRDLAFPAPMLNKILASEKKPANSSQHALEQGSIHFDISTFPQVSYLVCKDIGFVLDKLTNASEAIVFTVTPQMGYEIIEYTQIAPNNNKSSLATVFDLGELSYALKSGRTVILKIASGMLSRQLEEALESLFLPHPYLVLNGFQEEILGRVIIISETDDYFQHFDNKVAVLTPHNQQIETLRTPRNSTHLNRLLKAITEVGVNLSYSQIKHILSKNASITLAAILPYVLAHPDATQLKSRLTRHFALIPSAMEIDSESPLDEFSQRCSDILSWLNHNPCIFLIGPTGSGKSTLVLKTLPAYLKENVKLFVGLEKLEEWANAKAPCTILFIDEANLLPEASLELFEDLYNPNPGIMINNRYVKLTPNHKVIFAGNVSNYLGRVQHAMPERHGIYFELPALSDKTLENNFIIPWINKVPIQATPICEIILQTYHFVNEKTETILTPRNLKNISMRFALLMQNQTSLESQKEIAWLSCYDEIRYLVTPETKKDFKTLIMKSVPIEKYKELKKQFVELYKNKLALTDYAVTHVKQRRMIYDFLHMDKSASGLILEGLPGIGKSTLLQKCLEALKIPFVFLQSSNEQDAIAVLHHAFHYGLVVVIDELNTMPYLEYALNAFMMGEDLNGSTAQKEGFRVMATQNPITFGGRYPLSPALQNRFIKINLKEYNFEDLKKIALHKGLNEEKAFFLTRDYTDAIRYAQQKNVKPGPTARDFINTLGLFAPVKCKEIMEDVENRQAIQGSKEDFSVASVAKKARFL